MDCYRYGGCGPYETYSCNDCPWSKLQKESLSILDDRGEKALELLIENGITPKQYERMYDYYTKGIV